MSSFSTRQFDQIFLWHNCLGHPQFTLLKKLFPKLFQKIDVSNLHCESCMLAKHHSSIFPIKGNQISTLFIVIHSDLWGPSRITNIFGSRWFDTFIDDCTRITWVYPMKIKLEVSSIYSIILSRISLGSISILWDLTMEKNTSTRNSRHIYQTRAFHISQLASIHLNKMVLLKERIDIFLKLLDLFCSKLDYQNAIGEIPYCNLSNQQNTN